jgi:integrase
VKHPAALPWQDVAAFLTALRSQESISARALEVPILTAARSGEILGMHWGEVDREGAVWTVPADRMKARREHRVALSEAAVAILRTMEKLRATEAPDAYVFPGRERSRPLSIMSMPMLLRRMNHADLTVHGFRSCFRDWVGETTAHPREVVEAALAHRTGDKVEQAYARGDLFTKRRKLMTDWAQFCARDPGGIVLQMRPAALDAPCSTVAQYPGEPGRHF